MPAGRVIFVEQRLEVLQRPIGLGARQRRHQMVDDHRAGAALGLRALAGIVDDERIEMRQLAPEQRRIARLVERHGLARQPFERAMLAIVDQRVRRRTRASARDRPRDRHAAAPGPGRDRPRSRPGHSPAPAAAAPRHCRTPDRQMEHRSTNERIDLPVRPSAPSPRLHVLRQRRKQLAIARHRKGHPRLAPDAHSSARLAAARSGIPTAQRPSPGARA